MRCAFKLFCLLLSVANPAVAEIRNYQTEIFSYREPGQILFMGVEGHEGTENFLYVDPLGGRHRARCVAPGVFEYESGNSRRKVKEVIIDGRFTGVPEPEEVLREILTEHRTMVGFSPICRGFATFEHRYRDPVSSLNNWDSEQVFDENGNLIENGFRRAGALMPVESEKAIEVYN